MQFRCHQFTYHCARAAEQLSQDRRRGVSIEGYMAPRIWFGVMDRLNHLAGRFLLVVRSRRGSLGDGAADHNLPGQARALMRQRRQ